MAERKTTTRKAAAKTGTRTAAKKPAAKAAASGASTARRKPADDQPVTVVIAAMGATPERGCMPAQPDAIIALRSINRTVLDFMAVLPPGLAPVAAGRSAGGGAV